MAMIITQKQEKTLLVSVSLERLKKKLLSKMEKNILDKNFDLKIQWLYPK